MIRRSRAFRPNMNHLESRVVMSVAATPQAAIVSAARPVVVTSGTLTGKYLATGEDLRAADAPYQVNLNGSGNVRGLGKVTMTGSLNFGGFKTPNQPDLSGSVTLTNAGGSLTIQLTGSGGYRTIPNARFGLNASIVSGTGAYANIRGIGSVNAQFGKSVIQSVAAPSPIGGSLKLSLNLKPPVR